MSKKYFIGFILALTFFIASLLTLSDYGVSWDEATHFKRGQAYLHFFITGNKNYGDLKAERRSFYQSDKQDANFWLKDTFGHPPLNGILASLSNFVFYQKLGIMPDIESYHLFNIVSASILVFVVFCFGYSAYGLSTGIVGSLVLSLYPLFWSESHFNIKDPPEAAFFAGTIWCFWEYVKSKNARWLVGVFSFFLLALGTKFNALFIPFILAGYLMLTRKFSLPERHIKYFVFGSLIVGLLFVASWPALWQNLPHSLQDVFAFYKEVGSGTNYQPSEFYFLGFNLFPAEWILFTTPPIAIVLVLIGLAASVMEKNKDVEYMLLLWLAIPIIRVSLPSTSIYGGVRQIMEFVPAMGLIAAYGARTILLKIKNRLLFLLVILLLLLYPVVAYHPNENVYFNFIIGGLRGARMKNYPAWGNSYGNAYRQGAIWINSNVPIGAKLTLLQGELINLPKVWLRNDINYSKENYSGIKKSGEYIMELTFNDTVKSPKTAWDYVENNLTPVHRVEVDGVSILTIWENN